MLALWSAVTCKMPFGVRQLSTKRIDSVAALTNSCDRAPNRVDLAEKGAPVG